MVIKEAEDQIRAVARLRSQRLNFGAFYPGRRTPGVVLALGYYRPPFKGFQFAALPTGGNLFPTVDDDK
jgi:hypothetical protein